MACLGRRYEIISGVQEVGIPVNAERGICISTSAVRGVDIGARPVVVSFWMASRAKEMAFGPRALRVRGYALMWSFMRMQDEEENWDFEQNGEKRFSWGLGGGVGDAYGIGEGAY